MSNIAIFKSGKTPEYLKSVNTPDYSSDPDVLVNPDISTVESTPMKFWKRVGNTIQVMTVPEQQIVLDAEVADKEALIQSLNIDAILLAKALVKAGVLTKAQLVNAIKQVI